MSTSLMLFDEVLFEPITFVKIPCDSKELLRRGHWRLPVPEKLVFTPITQMKEFELMEMRIVEIKIERFCRETSEFGRQASLLGFTRQEALALLLVPDWLPGQRVVVEDIMAQNDQLVEILMEAL